MGFAGNLHTISLVEVFQTLDRIKATGVLRLASESGGRDVVFDAGAIIGVAFRAGERKQALLKRLILLGKLDANSAAGLSAAGSESAVVNAVVDQGWVSADDVSIAYEQQAREELQSLSSWDYADFVFEDAGPDKELATQLVERYRKFPIKIDMSHLLIESARRADEWLRMREVIPDGSAVFSPTAGADTALRRISKEYPASAIVPLIDGVRSVDDVMSECVSTRLDIYGVIVELLEERLLVQLTPDQLLENADHMFATMDFARAARVYRGLMSQKFKLQDIGVRLSACLEHLGDPQEAAACMSQLALQRLDVGEVEGATESARRAVELAPDRADSRLALARCLIQGEKPSDAIEHLQALVTIYQKSGQLEEARNTCLKILQIDAKDDGARRELARIYSQGSHEQQGEDVVVCIRCDHVNHREAAVCAKCSTPLQLTCLSCNRIVGVSDKLCIFCGADPHAGAPKREASGRPTTARFIKSERISNDKKGVASWREKIANLLQQATDLETAGELEESLKVWREVAGYQHDSTDVQARIREIELRINQQYVADQIAEGHRLRKNRHFWRALVAYHRALRSIPEDDPRCVPLRDIIATTKKWHRRNAIIYGMALLFFVVVGAMAAYPYYQLHKLRDQAIDVQDEIDALPSASEDAVVTANADFAALELKSDHIRGHAGLVARQAVSDLEAELVVAKTRSANHELKEIALLIDQGSVDEASQRIANYASAFDALLLNQVQVQVLRLQIARKNILDRDLLIKNGPDRLARAQVCEQKESLNEALSLYQSLVASPDQTINVSAKSGVERLAPERREAVAQIQAAEALIGKDLRAAQAALSQLESLAKAWDYSVELHDQLNQVAHRLQDATTQWAALGDQKTIPQLEAFTASFPGTVEGEAAAARLAVLRQQQESHAAELTRYHDAMNAKQWSDAWQAARDLQYVIGTSATAETIAFPLLIETMPSGATITFAGRTVGTSPCVVTWLPAAPGELAISAAGWQGVQMPITEAGKNWRLGVRLTRQSLWMADLKQAVVGLVPNADGILATTADALITIRGDGRTVWSHAIPHGSEENHSHVHEPVVLPTGEIALAQPDQNVEIIDHSGNRSQLYATSSEVRGRPAVYSNELMGGQPRLAFASEALFAGGLGDQPQTIPLPAVVIAGPVVVAKDLDRVLVTIDIRGRLVGIEESTRKQVWDMDLQAADAGELVPAGADQYATVLDGSRLEVIGMTADGPAVRWLRPLPGPALGDPVVVAGQVYLASGDTICRFALDGTVLPTLKLSAPATTPLAASGDYFAVGCQDGTVSLFHQDTLHWQSAIPAQPEAIALTSRSVVVGLSDGRLIALLP